MSDEAGTPRDSYDDIPYESTPFADTHPGHLAALARLYGVEAVDPARCRVLELGCANGGNLIPMAARLPGSRFVGIELSTTQARDGAGRVAELGLDNCEIRAADLMDFHDDEPFDYIIAHGVWSWTPPAVRDRIFALAAEQLSERGIAYISYNALPGWRMRGMLRDMLLHHVRDVAAPGERLRRARHYLDFLEAALEEIDASNAHYLRFEIERIRAAHPSYLFHEYLETFNEPVLFRDFVAAAAAHGLDYVCDIEQRMQFSAFLGDRVEALLMPIADPFERWQQIDFLVNRNFHQSLLCRAGAGARREPELELERLREFRWFADLKAPRKLNLRAVKAQAFTAPDGETHPVEHPLTKAALHRLGEVFPRSMSFAELRAAAVEQLRGYGALAFADDDMALLGELFSLFAIGVVHVRPDGAEELAGEPPGPWCVDAVAAQCARRGDGHVPGRHHGTLGLDRFSQWLVQQLDGRREREALIDAALDALRADGALAGLLPPEVDPDTARRQVTRNLDRLLALFRRQGVIAGL